MRLKLDENLPDDARAAAVALGHGVDTVIDEELGGATDPMSSQPPCGTSGS